MSYDFSTLSPADFEDLVRELIGRELTVRFEGFAAGPDGGVDGRHSVGSHSTILQAKHYAGSRVTALASVMRRERASIDRLAPGRYVLATSRALSRANKVSLARIIGPWLKTEADIFGPTDLNALLRKYPEAEKAHIKLWLSGTAVLERVLRSAAHAFTAISRADIERKVGVYAENPSFKQSRDKLESRHVVIIAGPPGVGKTTLAEMLAYAYIGDEWEFVSIRDLEDGFASISDTRKQIFFFDDFLGRSGLDARLLASRDSHLARFIDRVRRSPNARFILTTRAHVFEEARRLSEHLADKNLDITKYLLDVGVYTREIKARILYNHLLVAGTPKPHIRTLVESGKIPRIVDHKNYNPRLIDWMTDGIRLADIPVKNYVEAFLDLLDNPDQLWDTAFRTSILEKCRHLLYALFFSSQYGAELSDLRLTYDHLHPTLSAKYGTAQDPTDFEESIRILEGGFIAIRGSTISFINPSLRDYLMKYLDDQNMLLGFAACVPTATWAKAVWEQGNRDSPFGPPNVALAYALSKLAPELIKQPVWGRTGTPPHAFRRLDLYHPERIELLLDWWTATRQDALARLAVEFAKAPPAGFDAWNGKDMLQLVGKLRDGGYYDDFPYTEELVSALEAALVNLLRSGMSPDDLENVSDESEELTRVLGDDLKRAIEYAIIREIDEVLEVTAGLQSESEVEDHIKIMDKLAPRAGVPIEVLDRAKTMATERLDQITKQTVPAEAPPFSASSAPANAKFDDEALRNLFALLIER
jgi:energy-coupling factor transporter ATP-binding protein EcfA2